MLLEQSQQSYRLRWEPLIVMAGEEKLFHKLYGEVNAETVFEFLAFNEENPSSIVQCISKARENARTIRDRISREMWEDINGLYYAVTRFHPREEIAAGPHLVLRQRFGLAPIASTASPTPRCPTMKAGNFSASAGRSSAPK